MRLRPSLRLFTTALTLTLALAAFPLASLASHQFGDVPDSNPFHADIDAIADAGVTTGCGGGNYCPSEFVTREQMAAFMNRLGALGSGKTPVVNADQLDGLDSTDLLTGSQLAFTQDGPWVVGAGGSVTQTFTYFANTVVVAGSGAGFAHAALYLTAPAVIGQTFWGFDFLEICFVNTASNVQVTDMSLFVTNLGTSTTVVTDGTDFDPSSTCRQLTDPTPNIVNGSYHLNVIGTYTAAGSYTIASVTTHWVPVPGN